MNIKEAARQTGLTKKAIKYYEQEGLITVSKNPDNGYREYSAQNVNTLKMIAALRMLALSVSDIKAFLLEGSSLHDILRRQHQKLSRQIEELEQERKLTEMLIKRVEDAENVDSILHDIGEVKIDEPKYMGLQLKNCSREISENLSPRCLNRSSTFLLIQMRKNDMGKAY